MSSSEFLTQDEVDALLTGVDGVDGAAAPAEPAEDVRPFVLYISQ